jgi:hypothetical protein
MQVAQRGTSSTGVTGGGLYTTDRFRWASNGEETVSLSQATDAPDGFATSFKVEVTTADSTVEVNDRAAVETRLEGQDLQQLKFGSASAESFTVSFYVKSSVTGNYNLHIASEGFSRDITSAYTINSANTWEYKTITFVGDTATAIANDNTEGLRLEFHLHAGSTYTSTDSTSWGNYADGRRAYGHTASFIGTLNATWQITGVQLEVGTVATPFEHRSYGEELALCQRYYEKSFNTGDTPVADADHYPDRITCIQYASSTVGSQIPFRTTKRTSPSITLYCGGNIGTPSNATGSIAVYSGGWAERTGSSNRQSEAEYSIDVAHSGTVGQALIAEFGWVADAEL